MRTTLPHGFLLPRRRGVSSAAAAAALTLSGRRAILRGLLLGPISAAMALGVVRPVPQGRARRGCSSAALAAVAEAAQAEERERAAAPARSFVRTLTVVRTGSARLLHLATATLADPFVPDKSSSPHAEPAMDGRCLATTPPAVFFRIPVNLKHSERKCARSGFRCMRIIVACQMLRVIIILNVARRLGDARMAAGASTDNPNCALCVAKSLALAARWGRVCRCVGVTCFCLECPNPKSLHYDPVLFSHGFSGTRSSACIAPSLRECEQKGKDGPKASRGQWITGEDEIASDYAKVWREEK